MLVMEVEMMNCINFLKEWCWDLFEKQRHLGPTTVNLLTNNNTPIGSDIKLRLPDRYDGTRDISTIENFFSQTDKLKTLKGWDDYKTYNIVTTILDGRALACVDNLKSLITDLHHVLGRSWRKFWRQNISLQTWSDTFKSVMVRSKRLESNIKIVFRDCNIASPITAYAFWDVILCKKPDKWQTIEKSLCHCRTPS